MYVAKWGQRATSWYYIIHTHLIRIYVLKSCEGKVPETDLCVSSSRSSSYPYVQDSIISTTTQLKTHLLVQPAEKGISQYLHIEYLSLFGVISIRDQAVFFLFASLSTLYVCTSCSVAYIHRFSVKVFRVSYTFKSSSQNKTVFFNLKFFLICFRWWRYIYDMPSSPVCVCVCGFCIRACHSWITALCVFLLYISFVVVASQQRINYCARL